MTSVDGMTIGYEKSDAGPPLVLVHGTTTVLDSLLYDDNPEKARRVADAMLKMTKLDIRELQDAYDSA